MLRGKAGHIPTLRQKYKEIWNREWPHDDKYLRELARESSSVEEVLELMRECHSFEAE